MSGGVYQVLLTRGAEEDLESIYDYISQFDCVANADYVLDQVMEIAQSLAHMPERGSYPKELLALGIKEYRQVFFKPYRLIYRVMDDQVIVYLFFYFFLDMQAVLGRRLLGS